jgi:uncharacterized protein (TIGR02145 family)
MKHLKLFLYPLVLLISLSLFSSCKKKKDETSILLQDVEGNNYKTITIGTQTWMAENLRTSKYNDGSVIPNVSDPTTWSNVTTGAQCVYNNSKNTDTLHAFGRLYNWNAVSGGKLAPIGWHIPSETEWILLENYLIAHGFNYDGTTLENRIAKSLADTSGWNAHLLISETGLIVNNQSLNNKSGFTAKPAGIRTLNGLFIDSGDGSNWWSSTSDDWGNTFSLYFYYVGLMNNGGDSNAGLSIRCVKD